MIYGFNCLILDITDDELNIVRNVWNLFLITVKAVLFLSKIQFADIARHLLLFCMLHLLHMFILQQWLFCL